LANLEQVSILYQFMKIIPQLIRLLYPHGSVRSVLRGPLKGARFEVTPGMGATYAWGWEVMNQRFLSQRVRPGSVIYDVGANRGQMALYFSRLAGPLGQVFSFEPVPRNFSLLERNLKLNDAGNVRAFCLALAADDRPKQFCYDEAHHTMGTFADQIVKLENWEETIEVKCDTLDQFIARGNPVPDLLKIDVEGAGAEVLAGAVNLLRTRRPAIYMEVHASSTSAPEWEALQRLKHDHGYTVQDVNQTFGDMKGPLWGAAAWCEPPSSY
jgi:FkbM family methyltransferase